MTEAFGVAGLCILAAVAAGIGIVGLVVWIWFGREDDDDCDEWDEAWWDWLKEQDEMKERKDDGSR